MNRSDEVLDGIRRKIIDGTLPKENCRMTWYGPGTGNQRMKEADRLHGQPNRSAFRGSDGGGTGSSFTLVLMRYR